MAYNQPVNNAVQMPMYQANPTSYTPDALKGGGWTKVASPFTSGNNPQSALDPFNFTGWNKKPFVDTAGPQPDMPNYTVAFDPTTMSIADYLAGRYDHSAYDKFKDEAMRMGPSRWAKLANQDQKFQASNARQAGINQVASRNNQAMENLGASGGLSSGARERIATEGAKNYLSMGQDVARQARGNSLQIGINDEQNRISQLSQVPGMEMDQARMWTGARDKDIQNTLGENERKNQYNQNVYNQKMSAWAANKTADAQLASGKK